jgi:hypothetical protein
VFRYNSLRSFQEKASSKHPATYLNVDKKSTLGVIMGEAFAKTGGLITGRN